jgi:RND superfamily putative drug exporter
MTRGITERLAQACAGHPRRTLVSWGVTIVVALGLVGGALHGLSSDSHVNGTPESTRAANLLAQGFPSEAKAVSDVIVVQSATHTVDDPAFRAFVAGLVAKVKATGKVARAQSYLDGPAPVSADRRATLVQLDIDSDAAAKPVVSAVEAAGETPGFSAAITGDHSVNADFNTLSQHDLEHGELAFGLPAALVVLVLVFGALVAGLVPVLMAMVSIVVGLGIVALLSLAFELSIFTVNMLTGMGLALGIDYSLFVISRYREERTRGRTEQASIHVAGATASRAVLFSGTTFVVALFGMLLVPTSIMRSLAAGAIIVGVVSVAAALTLMPALLALLGDRVDALRVPILGRNLGRADRSESRFWRRVVGRVQRRPALGLIVGVGVMLAAAIPIFGLHIGESGVTTLPANMPSRVGYEALQREFPSSNPYPVQIVAQGGGTAAARSLESLQHTLAADSRFGSGAVRTGLGGIRVLSVPIRGDAVGPAAVAAVRDLRAHLVPSAFAHTSARVSVGGQTAQTVDYFDAVTNPTPYVLAFVLGFSLIVLTIAFRSIVVAVLSIALNLLSVGAAYGLLTLVFLHGVGSGLLGFQHVHTVDAWVPLFLFSVLFALSMDYQVFLMSRIKERYDETRSTRDAVATGISSTARIITGAALIIIIVFTGFASGQLVMFQQMGFGVAVALFLDATIIRSLVLPSALTLLGDRTWYLPRWLDWLPHFEIEPARLPPPAQAPAPVPA